jgi:hypothetical protein
VAPVRLSTELLQAASQRPGLQKQMSQHGQLPYCLSVLEVQAARYLSFHHLQRTFSFYAAPQGHTQGDSCHANSDFYLFSLIFKL